LVAELVVGALPGEHAEQAGLVDALERPRAGGALLEAGYRRIRRLAVSWPTYAGGPAGPARPGGPGCRTWSRDAERALLLDAETAARPGPVGRAHLDAFADVVADFAAGAEVPTLPALLDYLATAEQAEDGLSPGEVEVAQGPAGPGADPHRARRERPGVAGWSPYRTWVKKGVPGCAPPAAPG